jgi:hypothetical protein
MKGNHLANEAENNYHIVVFPIILLVWLSLSSVILADKKAVPALEVTRAKTTPRRAALLLDGVVLDVRDRELLPHTTDKATAKKTELHRSKQATGTPNWLRTRVQIKIKELIQVMHQLINKFQANY